MRCLEDHVREDGCRTLRLHVFADNRAARALYEKAGFEIVSLQMRKTLA